MTTDHITNLRAMNSRADAVAYVADIRGFALKDLAVALGVNIGSAAQVRELIVQRTVGARLNSAAIRAL